MRVLLKITRRAVQLHIGILSLIKAVLQFFHLLCWHFRNIPLNDLPLGLSLIHIWGNAKRGIPMAGEEMVNVVDMQSSFDAKA